MRLTLVAVGRLRKGPEKVLVDDYLARFAKTGRGQGLPPVTLTEVEGRGSGSEAEAIARALPEGAALVLLDERGATLTSPDFAARLGAWRDEARDVALVIGGADGLDAALRDRADLLLSFGAMVWPHMLVRVMLAEQLYRAASILAGSPYHRA
ncbi:23S rRNA (pseudouridine(1915)-N(3))-methyltransferase RlmH [Jannaschia seohaensis]|uniref:Ribosomal RNA large subunit methyltransferase H n=1 Tax=Jannaschia seohaensis TaxID=475081 RepID=A0A2Y9C3V2_9RHOB|nr:23S rRNA (pseudouridine(1915)-N(3))-methyltransferase RlmH [Jannaschia seohaensis]PWJ22185.1 23S rRNA (pseudouridine1915-N3)-methyltransferase [Jannaschia seohaensis]SSA38463.1 23S rRNA (pseudouridine1915-N3)-methyltransferase [Jannaschia seohaensis]